MKTLNDLKVGSKAYFVPYERVLASKRRYVTVTKITKKYIYTFDNLNYYKRKFDKEGNLIDDKEVFITIKTRLFYSKREFNSYLKKKAIIKNVTEMIMALDLINIH